MVTYFSLILNKVFLSAEIRGQKNLHKLSKLKKESKLGIIFISNHINCNDPFVITAHLPFFLKTKILPIFFLTYHKKFDGKIKSFLMVLLGCLPIGNGRGQNIRETKRKIKNGDVIFLFPEGCVSKDGTPGEDLGVLNFFSKNSDLIVQPCRIEGLSYFWDLKAMFMKKRKAIITYGEPFILQKGGKIDAMEKIINL